MQAWLLAGLVLLGLSAPLSASAQEKVYKLGVLDGGRVRPAARYDFVRLLEPLGFVQGKNLAVQVVSAHFEYGDLDRLARELVEQRPDVIVAMGPSSIAAAAGATRQIPIVMMHSGDPVGLGLVTNLSRPGGNITGNGWEQDVRQLAKSLELLKQVAPGAGRLGLLWHAENKAHPLYEQRMRQVAADAGMEMVSFGIKRGPDAFAKVRELEAAPIHALIVISDYITLMYHKEFDAVIKGRRLPVLVIGRPPGFYESAVLFYGPRMSEYDAKTAEYVARIFKGSRPGDLPIVLPSRWELVANAKAAAAMGLALPPAIRIGADEVLE